MEEVIKNVGKAFKVFAYTLCLTLFMISLWILFQKHVDQLTGISVELIPEKSLLLPTLTFCFEEPFKSRGYHYKEEDFVQNTYQLSDIFGPKSLEDFKNPTVKVKEVRSELFGLCYSVTSITSQTLLIELTRNRNFKVFINEPGDEFWIIRSIFPTHTDVVSIEGW